jgi:hypothetical protein
MSRKKKVWIPAIIAAAAAVLLVAYYFYMLSSHGGGDPRPPKGGGGGLPAGGMQRPPGQVNDGYAGYFSTLGTIAVFLSAASFSWLWFKKKLKSPSMLVRKVGNLLFSMHKLMGWAALILIVIHGTYFLINKLDDNKIYTGIAGFSILLTIVGYGYFINKVRNKWMRTVHRTLGLLWVPMLLLHAGGSAIMAVIATLAVGGAVMILERKAGVAGKPIQES